MKNRFYIKELVLEGLDCTPASLDFYPDTNIIIGPSNTGKSYAFQCLNYLLGSSSTPKRINESAKYTVAYLYIIDGNGNPLTIKRGLDGGDANLFECKYEDIANYIDEPEHLIVGKKGTKEYRTLSDFYLSLSNLNDKRVRKNATGETHAVGFPLIRNLTLIDEVKIIKEDSPILTGQKMDITKEQCFFKLMMTGRDDSEVIAKPKNNVVFNRKGQLEIIDRLIQEHEEELSEFEGLYSNVKEADDQIEKLGHKIDSLNTSLQELFSDTKKLETTVNEDWTLWKENESRMITVDELLSRFDLLSEHYESDKSRLESINETSKAFSHIEKSSCPVCGRGLDDEHVLCDKESVEAIEKATDSEILKINILEQDLNKTKFDLAGEKENLIIEINKNKVNHLNSQKKVDEFTSNKIELKVNELEVHRMKFREVKRAKLVLEKIDTLELDKKELEREIDPGDGDYDFEKLSTSMTVNLCKHVKNLLNEWEFDDVEDVTFSEGTSDIVINGNDRNLSGKGYRALAYSAFVIGLLHYCESETKPHSGVVILDSPLCTLRTKNIDKDEAITDEVKNAFYESIMAFTGKGQVIILDNDGPEAEVTRKTKYIEFTKDRNNGRYGFFPPI